MFATLSVSLCADEVVVLTLDPRTGRLNMRDTGDLAAAGRGPRFSEITMALNVNLNALPEVLMRLRYNVSAGGGREKTTADRCPFSP